MEQRLKPLSSGPMCEVKTAQERGDFQQQELRTSRLLNPRETSWLPSSMILTGSRRRTRDPRWRRVDLRQRGSLPGMQGIFLKRSARELEMVTAVKGGVHQGRKPSWSFTGKLSVPYGN